MFVSSRTLTYALLFSTFVVDACAPKTTKKPSHAASTALTCGATATAADIANPAPTQLALADLTIASDGIDIDGTSLGANVGNTTISADDSKMGPTADADMSNTFIMWRACPSDGSTCSSTWNKAYSSYMPNISDMSTGLNSVKVKICVSSKDFLKDADRNNVQNECDASAPCYCGKEVATRYLNPNNPASLDSNYKDAVASLAAARQEMLSIAQDYVNQATEYVKSCQQSDGTTPQFAYANNIKNSSPSILAQFSETSASTLSTAAEALLSSNTGLYLADASCASNNATSSTPSNAQLPATSSSASTPNTGDYSSTDTESNTDTNSYTKTTSDTNTYTNNNPTGFASSGSGGDVNSPSWGLIGLGLGLFVGGVISMSYAINKAAAGKPYSWDYVSWNQVRKLNNAMGELTEMELKANKLLQNSNAAEAKKTAYNEIKKNFDKVYQKLETSLEGMDTGAYIRESKNRMERMNPNNQLLTQDIENLKKEIKSVQRPATLAIKAELKNPKTLQSEGGSKWKKGIGGALAVVAGVASVVAGSYLVDQTCGHFMQTAKTMESKLLSQQQVIQDAMDHLSDAEVSAVTQ